MKNKAMLALAAAALGSALSLSAGAAAPVQFNVRDFGAKGDGVAKDTAAIQAAVDAVESAGGGTVEIPAGTYLTGSIFLKDNVDFHVGAGATLRGSPDKADYNPPNICPQNEKLVWPGESSFGAHLLLCIEKCNVTVRGPGTIDGNSMAFIVDPATGKEWACSEGMPHGSQAKIPWRPSQMLYFVESSSLRVQDLSLVDSPYWTCFFHGCTGVAVRGLDIRNRRRPVHTHNGDGIDVDCCQFVTISDCRISTADDGITLRASGRALKRPQDCAYVTVDNCILASSCNAVRIGVGEGSIHDATFSNIVVHDSRTAVNIVSSWNPRSRGVDVHNVRFCGMQVDCDNFLHCYARYAKEADIGDITFSDIGGVSRRQSNIAGVPGHSIHDLHFRNVDLPHGVVAEFAERLEFTGGTFRQEASKVAGAEPFGAAYTSQWTAALDAEIDGRIERFRKADGDFALPDLAAGAEVSVEQIDSDFKFGCNIFNFDQFGDERKNAEYRATFLPGGLFNAATVPFYWNALEPEKGRPRYAKDAASDPAYWKSHGKDDPAWRRPAPDPVLDFLDANGVSAHGHTLIYCRFHPKWACEKAMDGEGRWRLYADHIAEIGARYRSRIPQWDIVNESIEVYSPADAPREISSCEGAALPVDCTLRSFRAAAEAFPGGVRKCINGVYVGGNWPAFISKLVREGAPIDMIGHQMHIFSEDHVVKVAAGEEVRPNMVSWAVADQIAMLKRYDEIGLPVHVSEITIPAPVTKLPRDEAEALQARVLRDNYRLWFSWPSVVRITYWNLVDGMGYEILESGLLRNDLTKKPAYHALWRLVNEEWRTRMKVVAGDGGRVRFRGFKGRYRLSWMGGDGKERAKTVEVK